MSLRLFPVSLCTAPVSPPRDTREAPSFTAGPRPNLSRLAAAPAAVLPPRSGHSTPCTAPRLLFPPELGKAAPPRGAAAEGDRRPGFSSTAGAGPADDARMAGAGRFKLRF